MFFYLMVGPTRPLTETSRLNPRFSRKSKIFAKIRDFRENSRFSRSHENPRFSRKSEIFAKIRDFRDVRENLGFRRNNCQKKNENERTNEPTNQPNTFRGLVGPTIFFRFSCCFLFLFFIIFLVFS